jgi:hypothetical protein
MMLYASFMSSQKADRLEQRIDSCFRVLNSGLSFSTDCRKVKPFPFYESYYYQEFILDERTKSGAYCTEYLASCRLELLKDIYRMFCGDENGFYNLVDSSGNRIYDLLRINCTGTNGKKSGVVEWINEEKLNDLVHSYNTWYRKLKKSNADSLLRQKIFPASFSKFRWIKETGYISGAKSDHELLQVFKEMLNDTVYCSYFIKKLHLEILTKPGTDKKEMLSELMLLSLINNDQFFTVDVTRFELKHENPGKKISCVNIMEALFRNEKTEANSPVHVEELLDTYNAIVTLR